MPAAASAGSLPFSRLTHSAKSPRCRSTNVSKPQQRLHLPYGKRAPLKSDGSRPNRLGNGLRPCGKQSANDEPSDGRTGPRVSPLVGNGLSPDEVAGQGFVGHEVGLRVGAVWRGPDASAVHPSARCEIHIDPAIVRVLNPDRDAGT